MQFLNLTLQVLLRVHVARDLLSSKFKDNDLSLLHDSPIELGQSMEKPLKAECGITSLYKLSPKAGAGPLFVTYNPDNELILPIFCR